MSDYQVFEPRPGELARSALRGAAGMITRADGSTPYRVVDHRGGVVKAGTRDECLDMVERAWWLVEAAPFTRARVAAAELALRLMFERDPAQRQYIGDPKLTNFELAHGESG
jgi:hypothetical protein